MKVVANTLDSSTRCCRRESCVHHHRYGDHRDVTFVPERIVLGVLWVAICEAEVAVLVQLEGIFAVCQSTHGSIGLGSPLDVVPRFRFKRWVFRKAAIWARISGIVRAFYEYTYRLCCLRLEHIIMSTLLCRTNFDEHIRPMTAITSLMIWINSELHAATHFLQ